MLPELFHPMDPEAAAEALGKVLAHSSGSGDPTEGRYRTDGLRSSARPIAAVAGTLMIGLLVRAALARFTS